MHRQQVWLFFCILLLSALGAGAGTYTVTSTNDSEAAGTLRWAIGQANAVGGPDGIDFQIPPYGPMATIRPTNELPVITGPVIIDGTTQSGDACRPGIELDGSLAGSISAGLSITAGACTVRGLVINRFPTDGILLEVGHSNIIECCYIGTDTNGTAGLGNGASGIHVASSRGNQIGRLPSNLCQGRNVISGNGRHGIELTQSAAEGNLIRNNYIGTDVHGTNAIPNLMDGVRISDGRNNRVGDAYDSYPTPVNIISGNASDGVHIVSSAAGMGTNNMVYGNIIGLRADGTEALANGRHGLYLDMCADSRIGEPSTAGNVISGNAGNGILATNSRNDVIQGNRIGTDWSGTAEIGNHVNGVELRTAYYVDVGTTNANGGNLVSGNAACGVVVTNKSVFCWIVGNSVGTDESGEVAVGNGLHGVHISGGSRNCRVGESQGGGNLISGNTGHGLLISGSAGTNRVTGNIIGLSSANLALGNGGDGVQIRDAIGNELSGSRRNVISGNAGNGVQVGPNAEYTVLSGCYIGVDTNGMAPRSNGGDGVLVWRAAHNLVGQSNATLNVISGNTGCGVRITDDAGTTGNRVLGNWIGLDKTGFAVLGNGSYGVSIDGAPSNMIGDVGGVNTISGNGDDGIHIDGAIGTVIRNDLIGLDWTGSSICSNSGYGIYVSAPGAIIGGNGHGNVISGNEDDGVYIRNAGSTGIRLLGNMIGTLDDGSTPAPNKGNGVFIGFFSPSGNAIGGTNTGEGNVIAHNLDSGIRMSSGTNNAIRGNSIYSNGLLGIDLDTLDVSANDDGDADTGANQLQNFPVLFSASTGSVVVSGTMNGRPSTACRLEFFLGDTADDSNYGEGARYLGFTNVTTDAGGHADFLITFPDDSALGQVVTATATDPFGNTSEFGQARPVVTAAEFDRDGDGMPSQWESGRGLDPDDRTGDDGADGNPDGDCCPNWDEFIADTHPNNPSSRFEIVELSRDVNMSLTFSSTNTRYYSVRYTPNLAADTPAWVSVTSPTVGSNGVTAVTNSAGAADRCYRVEVQRAP